MANAQGIDFEIRGTASNATSAIRELRDTLEKLNGTLGKISSTSASRQIRSIGESAKQASKSFSTAITGVGKFFSSLKRIAYYRAIRSIIKGITDAFKTGFENMYRYSQLVGTDFAGNMDAAASAVATWKNSIASAVAPLANQLIPVLIQAVNWIIEFNNALGSIFATLTGKSTYTAAIAYQTQYAEAVGGTTSAVKELQKYLAPFDELNVLPDTSSSAGGGGASIPDYGSMFEERETMTGGIYDVIANVADFVRSNLESVSLLVDEFGFAIGVAVLASGNIPLGLGLMAYFGYKGVKEYTENWDTIKTQLEGTYGEIVALSGTGLLAVGLILAFSGASIPLGLGMIVAGGALLGTAIAANWDSLKAQLQGSIANIMELVGGSLLAIGLVLALSGVNIPLGLGLIAAGAVVLGTAVAANWDTLYGFVNDNLTKISAVISGATLAIGAILAFSGVNVPIGIALIAAGAAGFISAVATDWDSIKEKIQGSIANIMELVGGSLLAIGLVLALSGVNIPLGLGLIAAGAVVLGTAVAANWDYLKTAMEGPIGQITLLVSGALLAVGAILALSGVGIPLGLALMAAGGAGLAASHNSIDWDALQTKINEAMTSIGTDVKDWWDNKVVPWFENAWDSIIAFPGTVVTKLENWFIGVWNSFLDWVESKDFGITLFGKTFKLNDYINFDDLHIDPIEIEATAKLTDVKDNLTDAQRTIDIYGKIDTNGQVNFGLGAGIDLTVTPKIGAGSSTISDYMEKLGMIGSTGMATTPQITSDSGKTYSSIGTYMIGENKVLYSMFPVYPSLMNRDGSTSYGTISNWVSKENKLGSSSLPVSYYSDWTYPNKTIGASMLARGWIGSASLPANYYSDWTYPNKTIGDSMQARGWVGSVSVPVYYYAANAISAGGGYYQYTKADGGIFYGGKWHDIASFAGGGFPKGSQLFLAREAGPELVGTLGGHTAVMNNDQIVASVSAGVARAIAGIEFHMDGFSVAASMPTYEEDDETEEMMYRAFMRAMTDAGLLDTFDINVTAELDGEVAYQNTVRRNRANTRMTGVNALA